MKKLTEYECRKILTNVGIQVPRAKLATTTYESVKLSKEIGYPVVMKIMSEDIIHKSDAQGVVTGISSEGEVIMAFDSIMSSAKKYNPNAKIDGVIIEEELSGTEVIVGVAYDNQFGPVIMFGLGGIFVEVLKDVTFRVLPIERQDAKDMICEIKSKKILEGVRGQKAVNLRALEDVLLGVSKIVSKNPKIHELDINPLFVNSKGAIAGDSRIIISG